MHTNPVFKIRTLLVLLSALSLIACKPKAATKSVCDSVLTEAEVTALTGQQLEPARSSSSGRCSVTFKNATGNSVIHVEVVENSRATYSGLENVNTAFEFHDYHVNRRKDGYQDVRTVEGLGDKAVLGVARHRVRTDREVKEVTRKVEGELNKELKGKKNPLEIIEGMAKVVDAQDATQHTLTAQYKDASLVITANSAVAAEELLELVPKLDERVGTVYKKTEPVASQ